MGLDIVAYQHIATLPDHRRSDACWDEDDHHATCVYPGFEQSFRNLPIVGANGASEFQPAGSLLYGPCVRVWGEAFDFRAGGYSGYNGFRKTLCIAVLDVDPQRIWDEPDQFRDQPFFELINFADNEGTIGPEACADLAQDFEQHAKVRELLPGWYPDAFDNWTKAFALAANTGMVDFH